MCQLANMVIDMEILLFEWGAGKAGRIELRCCILCFEGLPAILDSCFDKTRHKREKFGFFCISKGDFSTHVITGNLCCDDSHCY